MRADTSARALILIFGFAWLAACTSRPNERQQATALSKSTELDVGKPIPAALAGTPVPGFNLRDSVERAQLAYRASADGHESFAQTYTVRERAGRVSVTPLHFPSSRESDSARRAKANDAKPERWEGSPLTLETVSVERQGKSGLQGAPRSSVGGSGELLVNRGGFTEVFENERASVEQSWRFAERPAGHGDLLVHVAARGQEFREVTATGLHFSGKKHGLGTRYGHATWIDASGNATAVPARWTDGVIELRVAESVVETAAYPAILDPVIGPEIATDEEVSGASILDETNCEVASDRAGMSLFVWAVNQDIYGARVNSTGTVLDPNGFAISDSRGSQDQPSVGFDGTNFLVAWADYRNGVVSDVYGARVSTGGAVLDPDGIPISTGATTEQAPVVSDGGSGRALVVWQDGRGANSPDIYGSRVNSFSGVVEDPMGIAISTALNAQIEADIAYNGTVWFVVWKDGRGGSGDIYGAHVDPTTSVVLEPTGVVVSADLSTQQTPAVVNAGGLWLVTWADIRNGGGNFDIYANHVDIVGNPLNGSGFPVTTVLGDQTNPAIAWDESNALIAWTDRRNSENEVYANRIDSMGTVLGSDTLLEDGPASLLPALAYDGTNFVSTWREGAATQDIFMARVDANATRVDATDIRLSSAPNSQSLPDAAFDGTNWLVVWSDTRNDSGDIFGARFSSTGTLLDQNGIVISAAADAQMEPRVDYDGDTYLVVWSDDRSSADSDIYGVRVAPDGDVLDPAVPITTRGGLQRLPDVAHNATHWLVVWDDTGSIGFTYDVYAARVSSTGVLADVTAIPVSTGTANQMRPRVVLNGDDWLVVWEDLRSGTSTDIYGARIDSSGVVQESTGIPISTIPMLTEQYPALASNGTNALVVWADFRSGNGDIYGAIVEPDGTVGPGTETPIAIGLQSQTNPAVSYDGSNWLVAWSDSRAGLGASDLFLTEVSDLGIVASPAGISASAARYLESNVAVAAGTTGNTLLVYQTTSGAHIRVKARVSSQLCIPNALSDTTCDGIDDDCSGTADEDFAPVVTTCGSGGCATTGMTSCNLATVSDSCAPDPTDTDEDGVPDCRDECPTVGSTTSTGCRPRPNPTAEAGSGGTDDGSAGASATSGGMTATGGNNGTGTGGVGGEGDGGDEGSNQAGEASASGGTPSSGDGGQSGDGTGGRLSAGGSAGDSDAGLPSDGASSDDDGCGCRVVSSRTATHGAWMFAGAALVLGLRRRKR